MQTEEWERSFVGKNSGSVSGEQKLTEMNMIQIDSAVVSVKTCYNERAFSIPFYTASVSASTW